MPKETDRSRDDDARDSAPYEPPEGPVDDHPLWLGTKIAIAMFLADLILSTGLKLESPTWGILVGAFLATEPPQNSGGAALKKIGAALIGAVLGIAGAYANQFVPGGASAVTFAVIGLVAGALASRSADLLFAAVVATVITFVGQTGNETVVGEAIMAAIMIGVGAIVGPLVVWTVERLRARLHDRRRDRRAET